MAIPKKYTPADFLRIIAWTNLFLSIFLAYNIWSEFKTLKIPEIKGEYYQRVEVKEVENPIVKYIAGGVILEGVLFLIIALMFAKSTESLVNIEANTSQENFEKLYSILDTQLSYLNEISDYNRKSSTYLSILNDKIRDDKSDISPQQKPGTEKDEKLE